MHDAQAAGQRGLAVIYQGLTIYSNLFAEERQLTTKLKATYNFIGDPAPSSQAGFADFKGNCQLVSTGNLDVTDRVASLHDGLPAPHSARAAEYGIKVEGVSVDWLGVRKRVEEVVSEMRALNLKNFTSYPSLDFILGTGRFLGPQCVEVAQNDGVVRQLTSKRIFIDTGTRPAIPDLPGLPDVPFLTSDSIQKLDAVPSRLLVLGAGYIGVEFAQMMHRFGARSPSLSEVNKS